MDRNAIEAFKGERDCILPESCIECPMTSGSSPQACRKNYGDISLCSPEEPP